MNFCPVCKREYTYKQMGDYQTGRCVVCGSMLVQVSDDDLHEVRKTTSKKVK